VSRAWRRSLSEGLKVVNSNAMDIGKGSLIRWLRRTHAALLFLVGGVLFTGGIKLAWLGGSPYYIAAGTALGASGLLLWKEDGRSAWVYAALLIGTTAWSIVEAGADTWGLVARLAALVVLGTPFLSRSFRRMTNPGVMTARLSGARAAAGALVIALLLGAGLRAIAEKPVDPLIERGILANAPGRVAQPLATNLQGDWPHYGNDAGGARFSPLAQITPQNVGQLEVAWEADLGPPGSGAKTALEVTPINIGNALFLCSAYNFVISLDAESGRERWRFDMTRREPASGKPCRGVSYYRVPSASGICAERILAGSQSADLFALDAATGQPCPGFGNSGYVSLRDGMGQVPAGYHYVSSAPQIVRGKVVVGGAVMDGQFWGEPSGVIRAYDAVSGQLAWAFDAGRPDRRGAPAEGETYTPATPNSWAPISADETLGLVYLPTGNATPDFYGAQRRTFDDDIASSVLALDAETGALRWRFQTVHHDIWDYDVPAQPTLVDLRTSGGIRKALIQPTKRGEIFVLDRETGEPIKRVEELPVPQGGTAEGVRLSPTQPF